jgi:uncharacterized protein with NAD-binding domain and iron-sulfur cluster
VIGGGLAGCEAAWQAASMGVPVVLSEMRSAVPTAVHKTDRLAELVCSNSFRGDKLDNAVGLLKEEMRRLGSLIMREADRVRVPAGAALAVDREQFAEGGFYKLRPSNELDRVGAVQRFESEQSAGQWGLRSTVAPHRIQCDTRQLKLPSARLAVLRRNIRTRHTRGASVSSRRIADTPGCGC